MTEYVFSGKAKRFTELSKDEKSVMRRIDLEPRTEAVHLTKSPDSALLSKPIMHIIGDKFFRSSASSRLLRELCNPAGIGFEYFIAEFLADKNPLPVNLGESMLISP